MNNILFCMVDTVDIFMTVNSKNMIETQTQKSVENKAWEMGDVK